MRFEACSLDDARLVTCHSMCARTAIDLRPHGREKTLKESLLRDGRLWMVNQSSESLPPFADGSTPIRFMTAIVGINLATTSTVRWFENFSHGCRKELSGLESRSSCVQLSAASAYRKEDLNAWWILAAITDCRRAVKRRNHEDAAQPRWGPSICQQQTATRAA